MTVIPHAAMATKCLPYYTDYSGKTKDTSHKLDYIPQCQQCCHGNTQHQ